MKRIHFFELLDLPGWPSVLRRGCTNYLQWVTTKLHIFEKAPEVIGKALKTYKAETILDLGSGSGGPWLSLYKKVLEKNPGCKIILSDRYPDEETIKVVQDIGDSNFSYKQEPVDAMNVEFPGTVLRTQFFAFHHFRPQDAKQFLRDAVESQHGVLIFDGSCVEKRKGLITSPMIFLMALFSSPFWKPFRLGNIVFSLIPVLPLSIMFDGIVSWLRFYSKNDMEEMVAGVDKAGLYYWEVMDIQTKYGWLTYLLGFPKAG